jgi:hypothetical protein
MKVLLGLMLFVGTGFFLFGGGQKADEFCMKIIFLGIIFEAVSLSLFVQGIGFCLGKSRFGE